MTFLNFFIYPTSALYRDTNLLHYTNTAPIIFASADIVLFLFGSIVLVYDIILAMHKLVFFFTSNILLNTLHFDCQVSWIPAANSGLISDVYLPGNTESGSFSTCMKDAASPDSEEACKRGLLSNYKYVFVVGQLLHGMGASPLYTLGVSYLDDNLLPAITSLFVGMSSYFYLHRLVPYSFLYFNTIY